MSDATPPGRSGLAVRRRPQALVACLTLGLAGLAATLAAGTHRIAAVAAPGRWWTVVVATVGFYAAERVVFNVEYRRESVSFSLAEVPLAFALVFLGPIPAIGARLAGSLTAHLVGRKPTATKLAFNASLFAVETSLAAWIAIHLTSPRSERGDVLLALLVAVAIASVLGGMTVSLAVACFEGRLWSRLADELRTGAVVYALGAVVGVVGVIPALVDWRLSFLPVVPVIVVWRLLYTRGVLAQQYRDLEELHAFTDTIGHSLSVDRVAVAAADEIRRLLRAEHAAVVAFDPVDGQANAQAIIGSPGPLPRSSTVEPWSALLAESAVVTVRADDASELGRQLLAAGRVEALIAPVRDDQGLLGLIVLADRTGAHVRFSDDDRKRLAPLVAQLAVSLRKVCLHRQVEREATHDRLTGLPGRALLESALVSALRDTQTVAALMIDIDRFKEINDTLGHHTGDAVLREFAVRVTSALGPDDTLARFAGDEFAIVAPRSDPASCHDLAQRILERLRRPFDVGELTIAVACSIGSALSPPDATDNNTLLRQADVAMYDAKARSSGYEPYRTDMDTNNAEQLALLAELRVALVDHPHQIEVHFQPKIDLARNLVVGAEALVRWQHPRHGLLTADRFINIAERTELIHRLSEIVLDQSLQAVSSWRRNGFRLGIAVNYSARSLFDELLADRIARQLEIHHVPPESLTIEVTESSVMTDIARATTVLERLRSLGVHISVDDYGTGYSSLAYLRRLPVTELKIDRAFITNLLIEPDDEIIVRSTIDLARHLNLQVVAEGIEAAPVAARLHELGCHLGQGYGFSRPLPLAKFNAWLTIADQRPATLT